MGGGEGRGCILATVGAEGCLDAVLFERWWQHRQLRVPGFGKYGGVGHDDEGWGWVSRHVPGGYANGAFHNFVRGLRGKTLKKKAHARFATP